MQNDPRRDVVEGERLQRSSSPLGVFLAVALILAAVVGGAMLMNQGVSDQASVPTASDSSTGASSGESGTTTTTPATPSPEPATPAAPEQKPETPPTTTP